MPYVPNPDDSAAPLNTEYASTAAADLRALKAKVNNLFLSSGIDATQNAIYSQLGLALVNTGGSADLLFGVLGSSNRTAGDGSTLGGYFQTTLGDNLTTGAGGAVSGVLIEAYTGNIASQAGVAFYGSNITVVQRDPEGQLSTIGQRLRFQNRASALDGGAVVSGLGSDKYNNQAVGLMFESQRRSSATERCGWSRGIRFEDYSLDQDFSQDASTIPPQAIDLSGISQTDSPINPVAFHINSLSVSVAALASPTILGDVAVPTNFDGVLPIMIDGAVTHGIPLVSL